MIISKVSMFKRWCFENKLTCKRNDPGLSHVLMDGGVLSVPFDKLNSFYDEYVSRVNRGEKLFVVEQKTQFYNFFVDIDYKSEKALTVDEIKDICKIICAKVKSHGGKDCLISVAPPKTVGHKVKTGIHLNWPRFVVDQRSAIALREHILIALYTAKGGVEWNDIIDSAVYGDVRRGSKGSGFRLPFSHKKAKHDACMGKGCGMCDNGKITQVAYLPLFVYKYGPLNAIMPTEQVPTVEIMHMATVRSDSTEHAVIEPPSIAVREGGFTTSEMKDELTDTVAVNEIEKFIQANLRGQETSVVKNIYKHKNQYFVSTNSKYCENIGRNHGSNHVWFYISGDIIAQKCFCRCETLAGRTNGFCKDFMGKQYMLTTKIKRLLYPEQVNCPRPKQSVQREKPSHEQSDVKTKLEQFIQKTIPGNNNTKLIDVIKQNNAYTVQTNNMHCGYIDQNHDKYISFKIVNDVIAQVCPCKKETKYKLSPSIYNLLKKNKRTK